MEIKVRRFVVGRDRPVVEIVNSDNCVYCPLASLYLTLKEELSHNTLLRLAYELRFFLIWLNGNSIDLLERIKTGNFLTDTEVNQFVERARQKIDEKSFFAIQARPTDKYLSNLLHQDTHQALAVSPSVTNGRLRLAEDYIKFIHRELNRHVLPPQYSINLNRNIALLNAAHRRELSRGQSGPNHIAGKSISNKVLDRLFAIIEPNHPENPFSRNTRIRNSLIVDLLVDTGMRRGALAKLKVSDIHFHGAIQKIFIRRSRYDSGDPRRNKPEHKTQEHFCYPSEATMQKLKKYIEQYRSLVPGAITHEYVFVVEKNVKGTLGEPISLDGINYIFNKLSLVLGVRVYPHLLRHFWNERFSDLCEEQKLTEIQVDKYRKLLMGWSPTSEMPANYNKLKDIEKSMEIARERQYAIMKEFSDED